MKRGCVEHRSKAIVWIKQPIPGQVDLSGIGLSNANTHCSGLNNPQVTSYNTPSSIPNFVNSIENTLKTFGIQRNGWKKTTCSFQCSSCHLAKTQRAPLLSATQLLISSLSCIKNLKTDTELIQSVRRDVIYDGDTLVRSVGVRLAMRLWWWRLNQIP